MATFDDSGIRFEYTLSSRVDRPQPQPTIENRTVRINTPLSVFSATVKATALNGSAELVNGKWRAGFIQEISSSSRIGHYFPDVRTEDRIWGVPKAPGDAGRAMRDSRGGELPYDGHSTDILHGVSVSIESDDDPVLELPLDLLVHHQNRTLTNITGGDRFTIWLAATKDSKPQRLVILGRIHWMANWRAVVTSANNTAFVPLVQLPVHERPEFDIARGFAIGPTTKETTSSIASSIIAALRFTAAKSTAIRASRPWHSRSSPRSLVRRSRGGPRSGVLPSAWCYPWDSSPRSLTTGWIAANGDTSHRDHGQRGVRQIEHVRTPVG
jgi:hypothetical protein